ncbi:hypothetical protein M128_2305 [Bacteroides fragilis str. S6L8]|uniref:Uncharacterized protein n=1 Tax=Bacteroides fragilis str. 3783N1-6 TaxID=1339310 RepID=A0AB73AQ71_BACFG|nr:hypothetical protein M118_1391 [Bacteroides fragilis str. 3783N1-2]EYA04622.1 hypothetical protein M126_2456 [Bacteroides fragilis str. S6L3]EYB00861.1 hypothetical protein M128_2305 [Bacteroides fragilis str. S6L8]EYB05518.1 hypothetical protein M129_2295 [Bacteroides fragilis str. S6R5]EYB11294.1 hypothetical protein M119_0830 [Bacteroides fragilis str. 3783N1-6]EYE50125.1 hypothetical protein M127_2216 [Bacteroides fragilis str. S6L5]
MEKRKVVCPTFTGVWFFCPAGMSIFAGSTKRQTPEWKQRAKI